MFRRLIFPPLAAFALISSSAEAAAYQSPPAKCTCASTPAENLVSFQGLLVDAIVTLGEDGMSVNERQAAVFDVARGGEVSGRVKVWHSTKAESCGVKFDYGRKYKVKARRLEDGALETDACLMPRVSVDPAHLLQQGPPPIEIKAQPQPIVDDFGEIIAPGAAKPEDQ